MILVFVNSQILFTHESEHLKLIGEMFDKCQSVLLQFLELVSSNIDSDHAYQALFPSIGELCVKYKLPPESAFFALRRVLNFNRIVQLPAATDEKATDGSNDMDTKDDDSKKAAAANGRPSATELQQQKALMLNKSGSQTTFQHLVCIIHVVQPMSELL